MMLSPLRSLLSFLVVIVLAIQAIQASVHHISRHGKRGGMTEWRKHHHARKRGTSVHGRPAHGSPVRGKKQYNSPHKQTKPKFKPGPWNAAHATFYGGSDASGTFEGSCGYAKENNYGMQTTALSKALYMDGLSCGACFEIKCTNSKWCNPRKPSIFVTATNLCPPNSDGGWCNEPNAHFDLTQPAFLQLAEYQAGIVPVTYRRVPCKKNGGIRFTITGNPYFNLVTIWNVAGAGDVVKVLVKGGKVGWTPMKRNWGQKWEADVVLVGESVTFRVITSDGRTSTAWHVAPKNWKFGQTFEGKQFSY